MGFCQVKIVLCVPVKRRKVNTEFNLFYGVYAKHTAQLFSICRYPAKITQGGDESGSQGKNQNQTQRL